HFSQPLAHPLSPDQHLPGRAGDPRLHEQLPRSARRAGPAVERLSGRRVSRLGSAPGAGGLQSGERGSGGVQREPVLVCQLATPGHPMPALRSGLVQRDIQLRLLQHSVHGQFRAVNQEGRPVYCACVERVNDDRLRRRFSGQGIRRHAAWRGLLCHRLQAGELGPRTTRVPASRQLRLRRCAGCGVLRQ
ncbi:hypothetical protein TSOC_015077, partial [Tetrabaena socialis]